MFGVNAVSNFHYAKTKVIGLLCCAALLSYAKAANSQTLVNVNTSLGNFVVELFDTAAPATVANFLSYVESGRYDGTFIHRTEPGFVVQGGGFVLNEALQQIDNIVLDPPVVNEFNQSNTRGTLAMAKVGGNPNSATSQWFVNLADNGSNLDNQNGGFTVFGRVVGDGMAVVDSIARLPRAFINAIGSNTPLINYVSGPLLTANLVNISMSVVPPAPSFTNTFVPETGVLSLSVAFSDGALIKLQLNQEQSSPGYVFRVALDSVVTVTESDSSFAQFNLSTGELLVPELALGGAVAGRNVRFNLSDPSQLLFTLTSFE